MASTSHQKIIDEVLNSMECPICMEILRAPIYMCGTGHNICQKCRKKLTTPICPVCTAHISDQRNYSLEAISSKLSLPCPNKEFGCNVVIPPNGVDSHAKSCKFKPFQCPMGRELGKCTHKNITVSDIEQHFKKQHPGNVLLNVGSELMLPNFNTSNGCRGLKLVVFENSIFLFHVNVDTSKSIGYWTVQWIANRNHHCVWKYEFSFSDEKHENKIIFSGKCPPMHKKSQEIFDSGKCVAIPISVLKNFVRENNLYFKMFIQPLKMDNTRGEKKESRLKKGKQKNKSVQNLTTI